MSISQCRNSVKTGTHNLTTVNSKPLMCLLTSVKISRHRHSSVSTSSCVLPAIKTTLAAYGETIQKLFFPCHYFSSFSPQHVLMLIIKPPPPCFLLSLLLFTVNTSFQPKLQYRHCSYGLMLIFLIKTIYHYLSQSGVIKQIVVTHSEINYL